MTTAYQRNSHIARLKQIMLQKIKEDEDAKMSSQNYTNHTSQQVLYNDHIDFTQGFQAPPNEVSMQVKLDTINASGNGLSVEQKMQHSYLPDLIRTGLYIRN